MVRYFIPFLEYYIPAFAVNRIFSKAMSWVLEGPAAAIRSEVPVDPGRYTMRYKFF